MISTSFHEHLSFSWINENAGSFSILPVEVQDPLLRVKTQSMNSSRAFAAFRGPQSFSYLTQGSQMKKKGEKKQHKHTNLSHLSCLPSQAWCGVTATPTFLSLHPVYEIEFQWSLPFLTRKGPNGFHLLWLRGAGPRGDHRGSFCRAHAGPHRWLWHSV